MKEYYRSPLTGDVWTDAKPALGTIIGLANFLNEQRPRPEPPEGFDEVIALATEAVGALLGIPKIIKTGVEGRVFADAYWRAKEAYVRLLPFVGTKFTTQSPFDRDTYSEDPSEVSISMRVARLAWYGTVLVQKIVTGDRAVEEAWYVGAFFDDVFQEVKGASVSYDAAALVERSSHFIVATGRTPKSPDDDMLVAAFEAALMAGETSFAQHLVKHGWGQRPE